MQVAGKLTALVGLPSLIIFSIFGSGVYVGARSADRVVELEQRWLGVEPPPGRLGGSSVEEAPATEPEADEPEPNTPKPDAPKPDQPKPDQPKPNTQPEQPEPPAANGLVIAAAAPVGPELRARFEEPRIVRVQLLVDPAVVVGREDWLGYLAQWFEATRASFQLLFGIELQLHGVLVWDSAVGADTLALQRDLTARERNGADVMLGLVAREQPADYTAPIWTGDVTGDHALIFADRSAGPDRYYRNTLRSLAVLFGAEPALDPASQQLGSFMSASPGSGAPVIDPENRGKVIINKRRAIAKPSVNTPTLELTPEPDAPEPDVLEPSREGSL